MTVKVSPDGKKIYASTGRGGSVVVVDANTFEVSNTVPVGKLEIFHANYFYCPRTERNTDASIPRAKHDFL
jgi:YVTN family beta-propeller protein